MLWACLHLTELAVDAVFADRAAEGPRAVYDAASRDRRVVCADPGAQASGIRPGLSAATARALDAALALRPRDPAAETARLSTVAAMAYAFSGQVALEPPDAVLLEIGASLRLFGGWARIDHGLRAGLRELGHRHRIAVAPTPAAARVFAASRDGAFVEGASALDRQLRQLPLEAAGLPGEAGRLLARAGLRRLGEAMALPRPALLRRVGEACGLHLDRLDGRHADLRPLYRPPDRFEREIPFEYGIVASDALLFPLRRLLGELAAFLAARDGGVARFSLRFVHEGLAPTRLEVGLRRPMREAQTLFDATRGRLERHPLPAPAHALALLAEDLPAFQPERRDLFEHGTRAALDHDSLVERLRARLGDDSVHWLALHADHRPERAWRRAATSPDRPSPTAGARPGTRAPARVRGFSLAREAQEEAVRGAGPPRQDGAGRPAGGSGGARAPSPAAARPPAGSADAGAGRAPPPRPLWLLPAPTPLRARIRRVLGTPERIESGWWDAADARRDYIVAELDTGQRAWLFREAGDGRWMVHGWFA